MVGLMLLLTVLGARLKAQPDLPAPEAWAAMEPLSRGARTQSA
jgi:hypothetical protein